MDSLQPGRELDALVAEKVMGWRRAEQKVVLTGSDEEVEERLVWLVPDSFPHLAVEDMIPHYSTDIAAAWLVCEHLNRADGGDYETIMRFNEQLRGRTLTLMFSGEAAHEICLAALKAVG